jgi:predicted nicotinamide N-methyase
MRFDIDGLVIEERPTGQGFYGEYIWPTPLFMCDFLKRNPELVKGKRILELGSGTGIVGLYAAKLGATHVTLTDFIDFNIEHIKRNIKENGLDLVTEPRWFKWGTSLREQWDVIIGSDIIYPAMDKEALIKAIQMHLKPGGRCIVGYNDRPGDDMSLFEMKEIEKREIDFVPEKFSEIVSKNHSSNIYRIIEIMNQLNQDKLV